jgi:membrane protein
VVALGVIALTTATALAHTPSALAVIVGAPLVFVGMVSAVMCLYRFAVGEPSRTSFLLPGAVVSAIGMIVLLVGFGAYASASTHYTAIYGAFGAAVVAMMATFFAVYVVLLGAVLNVELMRVARRSSITSEPVVAPLRRRAARTTGRGSGTGRCR